MTVRVPEDLKRQLVARAKRERRSVSAQVVTELQRVLLREQAAERRGGRRVLGLFRGAALPDDAAMSEVRTRLWGKLGKRHG